MLGWGVVQSQIPAVDFVHKYEHVFAFKLVQPLGARNDFLTHLLQPNILELPRQAEQEMQVRGVSQETP